MKNTAGLPINYVVNYSILYLKQDKNAIITQKAPISVEAITTGYLYSMLPFMATD